MTVFQYTHAQLWPKKDDHCPLSDHKGNVIGKSVVPAVHSAYPWCGINYHYSIVVLTLSLCPTLLLCSTHLRATSFVSSNSSLRWGFFVYRWVSHVATRFNGLQQFRLHVTNIRTNSLPLSRNPPLFILRAGRNRSINSIIKNIINLAGKTNTNSCGQGQSTSKQFDWLYSTEFS